MKFSFKDFFSKCEQIRNKLQIWSLLVKKSLMKNFIFLAVYYSVSLNAACLFGSFKIVLMKYIQLYQKLNKWDKSGVKVIRGKYHNRGMTINCKIVKSSEH